ncbi:MAG: zinc-binding dehydrogenase [Leptospira sp.]|nr:zinc-binding dehydrogenase [Leptospira sp.]
MNKAIESTQLRPIIDRTFTLDESKDSISYLRSGSHFGKIVIKI